MSIYEIFLALSFDEETEKLLDEEDLELKDEKI